MSLSPLDRPNSYIGRSIPRPNARRLLAGRGRFVDDIVLPRMLHAAFVRSPHAHAEIRSIDSSAALAMPGVVAVRTGAEIDAVTERVVGVLTSLAGMRSAPQPVMAVDRATWQGEPVAAVVATSRAEAEDAAARVVVDWRPLPAATDMSTALDPATPVIHPELGDNLCWHRVVEKGAPEAAFAAAHAVVEETFVFGRHTGVTAEPRGIVADWDAGDERLTLYHSGQGPSYVQTLFAGILRLDEDRVRVIARDVGGSFGIKIHTYGDEVATAALSMMLSRPIKFVADRLESFVSDIHARDHRVRARMAVDAEGRITALEIDDLTGIGSYSMYPRSSAIETNQILNLSGGQYEVPNYRAAGTVVFQNKPLACQYRAVGHPILTAATEGIAERAAEAAGLDPVAFRRLNLMRDDSYPNATPAGVPLYDLSHQACLERLLALIDYDALRREQAALRVRGVYRGLGLATYMEVTNPSPMFYGTGGAKVSATDGCTVRLEPSGAVTVAIGVTEQGQGTETVLAQIAATAVGVPIERVRVLTGDTDTSPYGGGTWASRGAGIGGEATLRAATALRENILAVAGALLQAAPETLDVVNGAVIAREGGAERIGLRDLATLAQFRTTELPDDIQPEFAVTRHFRVTGMPFVLSNGIQACHVEVDVETGFVTLLGHWVVDDCGRAINPLLVDEQVRGGVVQGLGHALFERCVYDEAGQLLNGTMADYLVPMAAEMPDIVVAHVETPTRTSALGAKGIGEAGTGGAPAAALNAVNDALHPLGARIATLPMTPEVILAALGAV